MCVKMCVSRRFSSPFHNHFPMSAPIFPLPYSYSNYKNLETIYLLLRISEILTDIMLTRPDAFIISQLHASALHEFKLGSIGLDHETKILCFLSDFEHHTSNCIGPQFFMDFRELCRDFGPTVYINNMLLLFQIMRSGRKNESF